MIPYWRPWSGEHTLFLVKYRHWQVTQRTTKHWHKHKRYVSVLDNYAKWIAEGVKRGR